MEEHDEAATYGQEQIVVLEGLEAVRKRPAMWIGDIHDGRGIEHLIWEVVGNSVDEFLAGHCHNIRVSLRDGWIEIEDDGRGIPVDRHSKHHKSTIEIIFTVLHAGSTYDGHPWHVHVTRTAMGLGLAPVNALSAELECEVRRAGRRWRIAFERGDIVAPLADVGEAADTGTKIRFRPDPEIFSRVDVDASRVRDRLDELARLGAGLQIELDGDVMHHPEGILGWVRERTTGADQEVVVLRAAGEYDRVEVDVAAAWGRACEPWLRSWVSFVPTHEHGSHVDGFWQGVQAALAATGSDCGKLVLKERLGSGLQLAVHVGLYGPYFAGPTRERLKAPAATEAVRQVVWRSLRENPTLLGELRRRVFGD